MSFEQIILELRKLNRADKLRAMQVLVTELSADEEAWLTPEATYELVTPYGNEAAAQVLYQALQAADKEAKKRQ
ncbi:MAG: hypothetical protein ABI835_08060 [Chloroflexota bacterium]